MHEALVGSQMFARANALSVGRKLIYPDSMRMRKKGLPDLLERVLVWSMIRAGFLSTMERAGLIDLACDGLVEHRLARRVNALVLLD
jgi:hypothetical protein